MVEDGDKNARFIVHPGEIRNMQDVAEALYPSRVKETIMPRRGDRVSERLFSTAESMTKMDFDSIHRLSNIHDL
jgi:hypothetical protein